MNVYEHQKDQVCRLCYFAWFENFSSSCICSRSQCSCTSFWHSSSASIHSDSPQAEADGERQRHRKEKCRYLTADTSKGCVSKGWEFTPFWKTASFKISKSSYCKYFESLGQRPKLSPYSLLFAATLKIILIFSSTIHSNQLQHSWSPNPCLQSTSALYDLTNSGVSPLNSSPGDQTYSQGDITAPFLAVAPNWMI